jgi:hypothetical protein
MEWFYVPDLTPWSRIFIKKLTISPEVKKLPALIKSEDSNRVHKSLPLDPILSYTNPIHTVIPYKIHFNITLPGVAQ